jgi:hypothetical protein
MIRLTGAVSKTERGKLDRKTPAEQWRKQASEGIAPPAARETHGREGTSSDS